MTSRMGHRPLVAAAIAVSLTLAPAAARQRAEPIDYDAIYRIKDEKLPRTPLPKPQAPPRAITTASGR